MSFAGKAQVVVALGFEPDAVGLGRAVFVAVGDVVAAGRSVEVGLGDVAVGRCVVVAHDDVVVVARGDVVVANGEVGMDGTDSVRPDGVGLSDPLGEAELTGAEALGDGGVPGLVTAQPALRASTAASQSRAPGNLPIPQLFHSRPHQEPDVRRWHRNE